jgi:hypothetical protein
MRQKFLNVSGAATSTSTWTATVQTANVPDPSADKVLCTQAITLEMGPGSTVREIGIPKPCHGDYVQMTLSNNRQGEDGIFRTVDIDHVPLRKRRAA